METHSRAPLLDYAPARKPSWLRRYLGPGTAGFYLLLALGVALAGWRGWQWRLAADEKAFNERAGGPAPGMVTFFKPPNDAALRHLARQPGPLQVHFDFVDPPDGSALLSFADHRWPNITAISWSWNIAVAPWLKEIARPDSGLTALTRLNLNSTPMTDACLKELVRPDSGLRSLTSLYFDGRSVTDAGLKELARPDSGLKALTTLYLYNTKVTDAGIAELHKARPGLKIIRD